MNKQNKIYEWIRSRKKSLGLYLLSAGIAVGTSCLSLDFKKPNPYFFRHSQETRQHLENCRSYKEIGDKIKELVEQTAQKYLKSSGSIKISKDKQLGWFSRQACMYAEKKALEELKNQEAYLELRVQQKELRGQIPNFREAERLHGNQMVLGLSGYLLSFGAFLAGSVANAYEVDKKREYERKKKQNGI